MLALGNPSPNRTSVHRGVSRFPFSIAPRDLFGGGWIDHRSSMTQHTRHKSSFAASRRSGDDASILTYDRRPDASPFLHAHRTDGHPVLVQHAFGIEVGEGRPFLHVRQHGRMTHPEPAVLSTSAPTVGEHLQERVLFDAVVTFNQVAPKQ